MKSILFHSTALALFAGSAAIANPVPIAPKPALVRMHLEKVLVVIVGDRARVSGTYSFTIEGPEYVSHYVYLPIYLPVYGPKGAPGEKMTPKYKECEDERWEQMDLVQPEEDAKVIASFGEMPQLDGQVVHWFIAHTHLERRLSRQVMNLEMEYWQKLSNGKFIYTPLLPKMKKDQDYGDITIVADRPIKLLDADKHDFVQKEDRLTVEPSHKRAVVVEVGKKAR